MQQAKEPKKIFKVEVIKYILLFLIFFSATSFANECIKGNCENGHGTYAYNSGAIYKGEWKNGKRHGYGTWTIADGSKYIGEWKNNRMHGKGTKINTLDGSKYVGEWKNGHKHGQGILSYINSQNYYNYSGRWKYGERHGKGISFFGNGIKYELEWRKGKILSQGRWLCPDGTEYVGERKFEMTSKDFTTWRKQNNYSKEQLAKALGVSTQSVNNWGKGIRELPFWLNVAFECLKGQEK